MKGLKIKAIDTHAHLWSEAYLDLLKSLGAKGTDVAKGIRQSETPLIWSSVSTFGFQNFMLGSDFPYFQDEKDERAVAYIKDAGLDTEQVEAILSGNAINFYQIWFTSHAISPVPLFHHNLWDGDI